MKNLFLISILVCVVLSSCSGRNDTTTNVPSVTLEPSPTATFTPTKIRPTRTFAPTQTLTPFPAYQTKQVILEYNVIGNHSVYDFFFESSPSWSRLVLYADGQIIIPGQTYNEKMMSPSEMEQFLSELESLGFYSIETNQKHDQTDKLYDFGNNYQGSYDALSNCIMVNTDKSRILCVYEPNLQYLVPQMKKILQHLDEYEPAGFTTYYPDRILLGVQSGNDLYDENLPATAVPWPTDLPSLEALGSVTYIDGDAAKKIYMLFEDKTAGKVFIQNGKEYTVYFYVVLPHEKLTNAYH